MDTNDLENQLKSMHKPSPSPEAARLQGRSFFLDARRSLKTGLVLILLPVLFLTAVVIKYLAGWDWDWSSGLIGWMADLDQDRETSWITPVIFGILPAVALILNLLSIMNFSYDRLRKELLVTIQIRWLNILIALVCLTVLAVALLYGIMESSHHRALENQASGGFPPLFTFGKRAG